MSYYFPFAVAIEAVRSPLFSRKIVEIERFALRAAILDECQNFLGAWEEVRKMRDCPHITAARVQGAPVTGISRLLPFIN